MGYRLIQDETLTRGLRRIARDEIESAIFQLGTRDPAKRDFAIHEARKSIKKLRGMLRMLEPAVGPSAGADVAALGQLGRSLSEVRDAAALVEAVDLLGRHTGEAHVREQLAGLRRTLERRGRETLARADVQIVAEGGIIGLRAVRRHVAAWRFEDAFAAVEPGLKKSYHRGRKALKHAHADPCAENYHALRKRVKDRWYQVRILEGAWHEPGSSPEKALRDLQEDLGDDHNLDVLRMHVPKDAESLRELLSQTQEKLRQRSLDAADELYRRKPGQYVAELKALWDEWHPAPKSADSSRRPSKRTISAA